MEKKPKRSPTCCAISTKKPKNAVNIIPPEIVFVIYEVICYAALNKAFNPAVLIAPAKLYVKIALVAHMHAELRLYLGV